MTDIMNAWLSEPDTPTQERVTALLGEISEFCRKKSWSESYFGKLAVGDDLFVGRLKAGKVQVRRLAKAERFLKDADREVSE